MRPTSAGIWIALLGLAWSTAAIPADEPPAETSSLQGDQTLEDVAKQLYDDPGAADEIRAINQLAAGSQPPAGQAFRLPGKQRQPAVNALGVAHQAVQDARMHAADEYAPQQFEKAKQSLEQARLSCRSAQYQQCQQRADETWALSRLARKESQTRRSAKNRFAVSVDAQGATRVEVMEGDGVEVAAQKQRARINRGQAVAIQPGQAPGMVREMLPPPEPILPFPGSRLVTASIHFHWKPVPGASRYVLLISRDATGRRPVRQMTTQDNSYLFRSKLTDGEYFWFLRAVDPQGHVGKASDSRAFQLTTDESTGMTVEDNNGAEPKRGP
jgi:hypothetical protein